MTLAVKMAKVWPEHEAIFKEKTESDERKMIEGKAKLAV